MSKLKGFLLALCLLPFVAIGALSLWRGIFPTDARVVQGQEAQMRLPEMAASEDGTGSTSSGGRDDHNEEHAVLALDPRLTRSLNNPKPLVLSEYVLSDTAIVYNPLVPQAEKRTSSDKIKIQMKSRTVYLIPSSIPCVLELCIDSRSDEFNPLIVITDKKEKVLATLKGHSPSQGGSMFSIINLGEGTSGGTLVWSVHTGGADLAYDHFLIEPDEEGSVAVYTEFARSLKGDALEVRGRVELKQRAGAPLEDTDGRGQFLSIPDRVVPSDSYASLIEEATVNNIFMISALPLHAKLAVDGEKELVLMQMDASRIDFTPIGYERFVYRVIELRDDVWVDASKKPAAQAWYRAMADSMFLELSSKDGAVRNWMLGSWASYKALMGELDDAIEIIAVKHDPAAFLSQFCELVEISENVGTADFSAVRTIAYIRLLKKNKSPARSACDAPSAVQFFKREMQIRGFSPRPQRQVNQENSK